uniref:F-box domain-containing protein n=1 Tax=Oryza meridionalis TaxID=40149 RepID=A0A0E0ED00_9ORYZ
MASPDQPVPHRSEAPEPPRQLPALTDELLEEIFLRIGSPADLARASSACVSFRRLIAGRHFLRRYRSVHHRPLLLGFVHLGGFEPAQPPHPSAPVARALAAAADFSFGRLLRPEDGREAGTPATPATGSPGPVERYARRRGVFFPDLAACDPLSRRYVLLAPIPDGLVASAQMQERNLKGFEAFLAPCGDEEATLRVIGRALDASKLVVFVFSSTSGQWSIGASTSWDALELTLPPPPPPGDYMLQRGHYCAYGCFFWKLNRNNKLLMLDLSKMKFSTVDLPTDHVEEHVVIVEAGEGRLGMLSGMDSGRGGPVYYFIRQNKGHGVQEWQMENIVEIMGQLSMVCDYSTIGTIEGFVLLYCLQKSLAPAPSIQYFSLDVRTMNLERDIIRSQLWASSLPNCHAVDAKLRQGRCLLFGTPAGDYIFSSGGHRHRPAMAPPYRPIRRRLEAPTSPPWDLSALGDELLEEIFVRIGSRADLARASAACASFRRLITARRFLRRYRAAHPALLLGFVHPKGFEPARPPHPGAAAARALLRAANFFFLDYLPPSRRWPGEGWKPCDARDGLVLLECSPGRPRGKWYARRRGGVFPDLAACDPLSRRPAVRAAPSHTPRASRRRRRADAATASPVPRRFDLDAYLAPCGGGDGDQAATFRVICKAHSVLGLVVFVFSSDSGQWSIGESTTTWRALNVNAPFFDLGFDQRCSHYCAYGCFYWKLKCQNKLLMLDLTKMRFSTVHLPSDHAKKRVVIVEAGEGRLGMLSYTEDGSGEPVHYYVRHNNGDGAQEWLIENVVLLSKNHLYSAVGAANGCVVLCRVPEGAADVLGADYFSLEVKTMNLEWVSTLNNVCRVYPYVGFPPTLLSQRRI